MLRDNRLKTHNRESDPCFDGIILFAEGTHAEGYFGDKVLCEFGLKGNTIVSVSYFGYYNLGLPDAVGTKEALWLLNHHPSARHITIEE